MAEKKVRYQKSKEIKKLEKRADDIQQGRLRLVFAGDYRIEALVDDDGDLNLYVSHAKEDRVREIEGNVSLDGEDGQPLSIRIMAGKP